MPPPVATGGAAPLQTAQDQENLAQLDKIAGEYTTDPVTCRISIKAALANSRLPQYYAFIYHLMGLIFMSQDRTPSTFILTEIFSKFKLIKMTPAKVSAAEKTAMGDFIMASFGVMTLLGAGNIFDTYPLSQKILPVVWNAISRGWDKNVFLRTLLGAHHKLVQVGSVIWKADFQATQAAAVESKKIREEFEERTGHPLVVKKKRPRKASTTAAAAAAATGGQASAST